MIAAFAFHALPALVTFAAMQQQEKAAAYNFLYWGTFIFAIVKGTLDAVANPPVATKRPWQRASLNHRVVYFP